MTHNFLIEKSLNINKNDFYRYKIRDLHFATDDWTKCRSFLL